MKKLIGILVMLVVIVMSSCQCQGQELWKGTTSSMNKEQVSEMFVDKITYKEAKYAGSTSYFYIDEIKIGLTPVRVDFLFSDLSNKLERVNIKVKEGYIKSATESLKSKLTIKYGDPTTKEITSGRKSYTWIVGATQITLNSINISVLKTVIIQYSVLKVDDNL